MKQKTFSQAQEESPCLNPELIISPGLKMNYPHVEIHEINGQTIEVTHIDRVTAVSRVVQKVPKRAPEPSN